MAKPTPLAFERPFPFNCTPADGVLEVGDVILGVGGKLFPEDARKSFGRAITEAEKEENGGIDGKVNALALLASGWQEYLPQVKAYARDLAPPDLKLELYGPSAGMAWPELNQGRTHGRWRTNSSASTSAKVPLPTVTIVRAGRSTTTTARTRSRP